MNHCKYCGQPTEVDPSDQSRPADYCTHDQRPDVGAAGASDET